MPSKEGKGILVVKNNLVKIFYWSVIDLQCCTNFCCTAKWLSYTHIYSFLYSLPLWFIIRYWISFSYYTIDPCCLSIISCILIPWPSIVSLEWIKLKSAVLADERFKISSDKGLNVYFAHSMTTCGVVFLVCLFSDF